MCQLITSASRFFLILVLLLTVGSTAYAEKPLPPQFDADRAVALVRGLTEADDSAAGSFAALSSEDQALVQWALQQEYVTSETSELPVKDASIEAGGCRAVIMTRSAYSPVGVKLWSYNQQMNWCYNGSTVTSRYWNRWGEVHAPFWSFQRHIGLSQTGGVGYSSFYSWTQGAFRLCLTTNVGCVQQAVPYVWQRGYGSGAYQSGGG